MSSFHYGSAGKEAQEDDVYGGFSDDEADRFDGIFGEEEDNGSSSDTNDSSSEDRPGGENVHQNILRLVQGEPVWTGEELNIVAELKDRWFRGTSEEQKEVVEEAVKAIIAIRPRDVTTLRKKVHKWLKRQAGKRYSYGPGNRPSLQTVLAYYKEAEVTAAVKRKYGVSPGGKRGPFLGHWKRELGRLQKELKTDPALQEEYKQLEAARVEWTRKGPPRERRKKRVKAIPHNICQKFRADTEKQNGGKKCEHDGDGVCREDVFRVGSKMCHLCRFHQHKQYTLRGTVSQPQCWNAKKLRDLKAMTTIKVLVRGKSLSSTINRRSYPWH